MNGISAAHKTLPFGTVVRVVDLETGRSVVVRINDRGPFVEGRIIDLSRGAAEELGIIDKGIARVGLRIVRWPEGYRRWPSG
jgi:rare lipoprotein A